MTNLIIDGLEIPTATGVDLGQLARPDVLARALLRYLTGISQILRSAPGAWRADWRYRCPEEAVLELGQAWKPSRLPPYLERGIPRHCYGNALALVNRRPGLRYVEGYAIAWHGGGAGAPTLHAWAVNGNGRVFDPTWPEPEHSAYFGIAFDLADVRRFVELDDDTFGILATEHLIGSPLLRTGRLFQAGMPARVDGVTP